ncbi:hypothetical protein AAFF_G00174830 [Aldrovandia affinis]|uniref:Fork-head domain-containing protein n=1 Tax=Aldrovandia affinis TaxID=143900 RepID=A0AAD7RLS8_9TELE|nr:hypothetical protein AAFF_G00174830 [Aldrovandia affinis]
MIDAQLRKAKSSRRNAWGNQSYADLITRAIESTPDRRLTLSQIYEWMVRCVPYFKDKGDSNSSAGWKNSIRHNLSLHSRFVRVQNEGTGKSSWWMLNPGGGKMGKALRRRAISIDNGTKWWKSKGRGGGKRAGLQGSPEHSSPGAHGAVGGEGEGFDTWGDLHSHTSSSDSALGGRLSPIPAEAEREEIEEPGHSHPASPGLHPTSPSTHPHALELPQLADLTGAVDLEGYPQPPQPLQPPHHKLSDFSFGPASERLGSYCGSVYSQPGEAMHRHHMPLQTIQESPDQVHGTVQVYAGTSTLQSLLSSGLRDCAKDLRLGQDGPCHSMTARSSSGPPNPTSTVSCHLTTTPQPWHQPYSIHHQQQEHYFHSQSTGYYGYHTYHHPCQSHKELPTDSSLEFLHAVQASSISTCWPRQVPADKEQGVPPITVTQRDRQDGRQTDGLLLWVSGQDCLGAQLAPPCELLLHPLHSTWQSTGRRQPLCASVSDAALSLSTRWRFSRKQAR